MKPSERWLCIFILTVAAYGSAVAREIIYTNHNCAITYPYGWQHQPINQANYIANVKDLDGLKTIVVQVRETDPNVWPAVNEKFKEDSRTAIRREGVITKERTMVIDGIPVWEYGEKLQFEGRDVTCLSRIIIAAGKAYKINTMYMEGDAATETNLQACLNSFRFLTPPPTPPAVNRTPALLFMLVFIGVAAWFARWATRKVRRVQAAGKALQD